MPQLLVCLGKIEISRQLIWLQCGRLPQVGDGPGRVVPLDAADAAVDVQGIPGRPVRRIPEQALGFAVVGLGGRGVAQFVLGQRALQVRPDTVALLLDAARKVLASQQPVGLAHAHLRSILQVTDSQRVTRSQMVVLSRQSLLVGIDGLRHATCTAQVIPVQEPLEAMAQRQRRSARGFAAAACSDQGRADAEPGCVV